ncbi:FCD domain-containing protein [Solirubrobacter taibaiensis]|nr:FCD domain-containing protein [Solirubrobacter taibaiensis]
MARDHDRAGERVDNAADVRGVGLEAAERVRDTPAHLDAMREANARFRQAVENGDLDAALRADDDLHGVPVAVAANRALSAVLDQFTPVLRRAERLRFSTSHRRESVGRHEALIRLCADGDVAGAAAVAFDTFHSLPITES